MTVPLVGFSAPGKGQQEEAQCARERDGIEEELGLDDATLDRETLIRAMVDNPILIERPIVLANGKAALGRPPEQVLDIL